MAQRTADARQFIRPRDTDQVELQTASMGLGLRPSLIDGIGDEMTGYRNKDVVTIDGESYVKVKSDIEREQEDFEANESDSRKGYLGLRYLYIIMGAVLLSFAVVAVSVTEGMSGKSLMGYLTYTYADTGTVIHHWKLFAAYCAVMMAVGLAHIALVYKPFWTDVRFDIRDRRVVLFRFLMAATLAFANLFFMAPIVGIYDVNLILALCFLIGCIYAWRYDFERENDTKLNDSLARKVKTAPGFYFPIVCAVILELYLWSTIGAFGIKKAMHETVSATAFWATVSTMVVFFALHLLQNLTLAFRYSSSYHASSHVFRYPHVFEAVNYISVSLVSLFFLAVGFTLGMYQMDTGLPVGFAI